MFAEVLRHESRQRAVPTGVLGGTLAAFAFFGLAVSGSLGSALDSLTASMPEALTAFIGGDSPGGYVVGEIFTLVAPIALVAYGIIAGAGLFAGEEREGTMAVLSAQPVTRRSLLLAKACSLLLSLVVIGGLFWGGMTVAALVFDSELTAGALAAGSTHLVMLALAFAAVALAVGAATGRPELASGTAGGLAVISYLTSAMLPLAGLEQWARLSPWHYALGSDPLRNGIDLSHLGVFAAITVVALVAGLVAVNRRDLKG